MKPGVEERETDGSGGDQEQRPDVLENPENKGEERGGPDADRDGGDG